MEMLHLIAGLAWDPEIRGFLAVLTGIVVLMGSVWLVITSNLGSRLGTLISLAGLFGWMAIMSTVWWIYGIGYKGDSPHWVEVEIVETAEAQGDLNLAALDEANNLHSENLPVAYDLVVAAAADLVDQYGADALTMDSAGLSNNEAAYLAEIQTAWAEYGTVSADSLTADQTADLSADAIDALVAERQKQHEAVTLSELAAVAPELINQDSPDLGNWTLLSTAEAGEAQASAIAMVLASNDFDFASQGDFLLLDAFTIGGKRGLPEDPTVIDRVWTKIRTAAQIKHPTRYGIVQLQGVSEESVTNLPGQAPKRPEIDPDKPLVSVVMVRDLGNLRKVPAFIAMGSLVIFLALCYMLHERDKLVMARRREFSEAH